MGIKTYMARHDLHASIDWQRVEQVVHARDTVALPIGAGAPAYQEIAAAIPAKPYAYSPYGPAANGAAVPPPLAWANASAAEEHLHVEVSFPDQKQ